MSFRPDCRAGQPLLPRVTAMSGKPITCRRCRHLAAAGHCGRFVPHRLAGVTTVNPRCRASRGSRPPGPPELRPRHLSRIWQPKWRATNPAHCRRDSQAAWSANINGERLPRSRSRLPPQARLTAAERAAQRNQLAPRGRGRLTGSEFMTFSNAESDFIGRSAAPKLRRRSNIVVAISTKTPSPACRRGADASHDQIAVMDFESSARSATHLLSDQLISVI